MNADRRGVPPRRPPAYTAEQESALKLALARDPLELLDELRSAWDMPAGRPIRVVGRLTLTRKGGDGRDVVFLNDFEHPETGVGLVYPTLHAASNGSYEPAIAFVPPGPSREVASAQILSTGEQWAFTT